MHAMKSLLALQLLALLALAPRAQRPAATSPAPTAPTSPAPVVPVPTKPADLDLGVLGGVQAPTQPKGQSTSTVRVVPGRPPMVTGRDSKISVRVRDLMAVRGQEDNVVQGVGLVTGLMGTGDTSAAARQAIVNLMLTQGIKLDPQSASSANIAVVWVEATLPPGIKPGRQIDCRVSSLYDSKSLVGGTLVRCELTEAAGVYVYGTASGPITTGAFSAEGESATAVRNSTTVGTIPLGCKVERDVPAPLVTENGSLYLDARALKGSFGNTVRVSEVLNQLYPGSASALDAMTVRVQVPLDLSVDDQVPFVASLLDRELVPETTARVVINERTGVIVLGEGVRITRGAVTKGNLTVTVSETPQASQPGPLSNGATTTLPRTSLLIEEEASALSIVNGAADLQEVVEVLNVLGVTPRDMIQILHSMSQSGMLHAEILTL
ncbi:MAG: flagellar basal body P-ring protein FlgI [Planctomycetota bacterium]|nr:MAG: flagellar basal body P-ring protein FlgI [Planctomycetota bacterium]